jgi:hypothetical protein
MTKQEIEKVIGRKVEYFFGVEDCSLVSKDGKRVSFKDDLTNAIVSLMGTPTEPKETQSVEMIKRIIKKYHLPNYCFKNDADLDKCANELLPYLSRNAVIENKTLKLFKEGHKYTVWLEGGKLFVADDANFTLKTNESTSKETHD